MEYKAAGLRFQKVLEDIGFINVEVHSNAKRTRIKYSFPHIMEWEKTGRGNEFDDAKLAAGVGRIFGAVLSKGGTPYNHRIIVIGRSFAGERIESFTVGSCGIWWEAVTF